MEGVAAAANIVGIVGFTLQALKVINWLKEFCVEYPIESTQTFRDDLTSTAGVLQDVKSLCDRIRTLDPQQRGTLRTYSLEIQINDCVKDLELWREIAKQRQKDRLKMLKVMSAARFFERIASAAAAPMRTKLRDRLRWHQENMKMTLSIFGRC